jgi:hypothetical protein
MLDTAITRSGKGERIVSFRINHKQINKLARKAKKEGLSPSQILRRLVVEYVQPEPVSSEPEPERAV